MAYLKRILSSAFESRSWAESLDALFEATGLVVSVLDGQGCPVTSPTNRCVYCDFVAPARQQNADGCFDPPLPEVREGAEFAQARCRAGVPCNIVHIQRTDALLCSLVIGGFVGSTRDRKRLFEHLVSSGIAEDRARIAIRNIPVLSRREVDGLTRLVARQADEALARAVDSQGWTRRIQELELFVEAGQEFSSANEDFENIGERVLDQAMRIVGADGGTLLILRPGTDILVVEAARGEACANAVGGSVHLGEGIAGRVAQTRRSVLVAGEHDEMLPHSLFPGRGINSAICEPLVHCGKTIGVLNVSMNQAHGRLTGEQLSLLDKYADTAAAAISSAKENEATRRIASELKHLDECGKVLNMTSGVNEVTDTTVSMIEEAFDFEIGGVVLIGWGHDDAVVSVVGRVPASAVQMAIGEAAGWNLDAMPLSQVRQSACGGELIDEDTTEDEWLTMSAEIMVRNTIVGYLFIAHRRSGAFGSHDRRLLVGLAEHAAAAFEKAALFARLRDDYAKTIAALCATLDAGERASRGRSDRVMDCAIAIGEQLELDVEDIELLRFAGLLHDVGKEGVSEEILLKPTRRSQSGGHAPCADAGLGPNVVEQIEFLNALAPVVMHHHERWDGEGYPMGLAGEDIPLLARVLAVADAFDAMTSGRGHRKRMSAQEARRELRAAAGFQFDPAVVDALVDVLDAKALAGATGLLSEHVNPEEQLPS